ncbi:ExbD/TolR family protein [Vibrio fortis]|uniref:ExbD/TolR family protein n=1 Tax=Vibrio fortis TaxID=212667 RepID=UPI001CD989FF|nr:biopolymer transporter ExbD [Vibrio fortis]
MSANFQKESTLNVDRPSASSSTLTPQSETLTVSVDRDKNIWFNGQTVNLSHFNSKLRLIQLKNRPLTLLLMPIAL